MSAPYRHVCTLVPCACPAAVFPQAMPCPRCPAPHALPPMPCPRCPAPDALPPMPCPGSGIAPSLPAWIPSALLSIRISRCLSPMPCALCLVHPCHAPMPCAPHRCPPCPVPHALYPMPCAPCPVPHALYPMSCAPCPVPHAPQVPALRYLLDDADQATSVGGPVEVSLGAGGSGRGGSKKRRTNSGTPYLAPHALYPIPCTPYLAPHTLHPVPCTPCALIRASHTEP